MNKYSDEIRKQFYYDSEKVYLEPSKINSKMAPVSSDFASPRDNHSGGARGTGGENTTETEKSNVIRFNVTKNELYKLDDGYKTLMRRQKGYHKILTNSQSISSDAFTSSKVLVLSGPREKFTENEFDHLKRYLETGGSLLVLLGEGGEKR